MAHERRFRMSATSPSTFDLGRFCGVVANRRNGPEADVIATEVMSAWVKLDRFAMSASRLLIPNSGRIAALPRTVETGQNTTPRHLRENWQLVWSTPRQPVNPTLMNAY